MDVGKLLGTAIIDAQAWMSGIDQAISGLKDLSAAAAAVGAGVAAGIGGLAAVGVEVAGAANRATVALGVMMKDTEAAAALMKDIRAMAAATPFESADLVAGAQSLMSMGFAAEEVIPTLTALGDAAAAAPAGMSAALPLIVRAFGQIRAKGTVSMEELQQLAENGVGAIGMLADSLGITTAEAMKRVSSGAIDAGTGLNALMQGIQRDLGGMMAMQSRTLDGVFSTLKDDMKNALGDMAQPLVEALTAAIPEIGRMAKGAAEGLRPFIDGMAEAARIAGGLAAMFSTLSPEVQAFSVTATAVGAMVAGAMGLIALAVLGVIPPVLSAAAAFATLDAAIAPILIVVGALGMAATVMGTMWVAALGIVSIELASLYALWRRNFAGIQEITSAAWSVLGAGVDILLAVGAAVSTMVTDWLTGLGLIETGTESAATGIGTALTEAMETAVETAGGLLERLRAGFIDMAMGAVSALQQLVSMLATLPGMSGAAAAAQGKLLQATVDLAAARGNVLDLGQIRLAAPDIGGAAGSLIPPEMKAAWDRFMSGTESATAATTDYGNALAHLTGQAESAAKGGKAAAPDTFWADAGTDMLDALDVLDEATRQAAADMEAALADFVAFARGQTQKEASASGSDIGAAVTSAADAAAAGRDYLAGQAVSIVQAAATDLSDAVVAGVQGFAAAGPVGAVVGVLTELLQSSESFQNLSTALGEMFKGLLTVLDPIVKGIGMVLIAGMNNFGAMLKALAPIFGIVGRIVGMIAPGLMALGGVLQALGFVFSVVAAILEPILPIVELAFRIFYEVMRAVALVILSIMWVIGKVWNAILDAILAVLNVIQKVFGGMKKAMESIESMKMDTDGAAQAMNDLMNSSYDSAYATAEAAASTAMMGEAAQEATESLMNVPSGYKVALARYEATAAQTTMGAASGMSSSGGGTTIVIENMMVAAQDPADLVEQMQRESQTASFRMTGVALARQAPRFSGSGTGGS